LIIEIENIKAGSESEPAFFFRAKRKDGVNTILKFWEEGLSSGEPDNPV